MACVICKEPDATVRCTDCDACMHQRCADLQRYELSASVVNNADDAHSWVDGSMLAQLQVAAFSADGRSLFESEHFETERLKWQRRLDEERTALGGGGARRQYRLHLLIALSRRGDPRDTELAGVAYGRLDDKDREYYIDLLLVLPRFARRGGASLLLASIEKSVRTFGDAGVVRPRQLSLMVERSNAVARRVYERAGFRSGPWPRQWGWSMETSHVAMFKDMVYQTSAAVPSK